MKITVIGGGGVRGPLFVASALRRANLIGLDEICLMDIRADKLEVMAAISCQIGVMMDSPVRITHTSNDVSALDGASHVVTAIRVGDEMGRVLDEKIALKHGVLGQETTGAGGFAMAMRSIPAIEHYAKLMDKYCPKAWLFNFTNPAGLVTQALRDQGFERIIGICDGANEAQHQVANWLKLDYRELRPQVFGLNHLSWTRRILHIKEEVLLPLLDDPDFLASSSLRIFEPELIRQFGMWLNEYLYYYYYSEKAVAQILGDGKTRGEEILELNEHLFGQLNEVDVIQNPEKALATYQGYNDRRGATYMHYARPNAPSLYEADQSAASSAPRQFDAATGEGYAGVALDIIQGLEGSEPVYTALNVPNEGAIVCMAGSDVVEVSCIVDKNGIQPLPIGQIPEHQELLMRSVKHYENLAVQSILERSREKAVMALMIHPLVMSYSRATVLVDEYLSAHRQYVGEWQ
jgi:alpha-galactosidase/6-phospho-beta-glucosidase family protein